MKDELILIYNNSLTKQDKLDEELWEACEKQNLPLVKKLYQKGAKFSYYGTIATLAKIESKEIFNFFWQEKSLDEMLTTMLLENTAIHGNIDLMKFLIEHEKIKCREDLMLNLASDNKRLEIIKYFISHGAQASRSSALLKSASNNYIEIVQYLIENTPHTKTQINNALFGACSKGSLDSSKYLIEKNPSALLEYGNDLILYTVTGYESLNVLKMLVEKGIDIHMENDLAFKSAAIENNESVVKYLIMEHGCNLNDLEEEAKRNITQELLEWNKQYIESKTMSESLTVELNKENNFNINIKKSKI